jgi:diacylglycerol kinase (ATP)
MLKGLAYFKEKREHFMRVRVIINPSSGQKNFQKKAESIVEQLLSDKTFSKAEIIKTAKEDDAYHAALNFKDSEVDLVIAVGGDGTINEVLNGLLNGRHMATLAILPAGTTNDFANFMKMPQDVDEFCKMIRQHQVKEIDVGKAGNQYFINDVSAGILTDISYNVSSKSKTVLGQMAYYIEAAKQLVSSPNLNTLSIKIHIDDIVIEDIIFNDNISNMNCIRVCIKIGCCGWPIGFTNHS